MYAKRFGVISAEGSRAGMPPSRDRMPSRWIVRTSVIGP